MSGWSNPAYQVHGQVITGANQGEQLTFVDIQRTLWSQSDGEPQNTSSDSGDSTPVPLLNPGGANSSGTPPPSPKFTGKLQGDYTWHFSIELPKQVVVPFGNRNEPQVFRLPQTFNERHARASICYDVSLRLNRGKLRADYRYDDWSNIFLFFSIAMSAIVILMSSSL